MLLMVMPTLQDWRTCSALAEVSTATLKYAPWEMVMGADVPTFALYENKSYLRLLTTLQFLPVNDKEFYTTDSTGKISAEYKRDGLPGDKKGLLTLVAKVEDNDLYGNLQSEKLVPWATIIKPDNSFEKRTLFDTRFKTPVWLLFMAYSIIICVWSVIFYLVFQVKKMIRLGKLKDPGNLPQYQA